MRKEKVMKQFTKYICVFLMMAGMSVSAWGETITITYNYNSDYNDMWDGDMTDVSGGANPYWKITGTATFSIPISIQPTSNITISIKMAYADSGTEGLEKISASGTETSSNWTMGETSACSHTGSDYSTCNFTITKNATPTTLEGLDITLNRKAGKNLRVQKIQVSYTSADVPTIVLTRSGSPVTSIDFGTITSAGTDEWTFDLSSFCTGMDSYDYSYYYLTLDDDAVFYESDGDDYSGYIFSDETQFKIGYVVESPGTYEATLNIEAYKTKSCGGKYDGEAFSIDIPITITYTASCTTSPTVEEGSYSDVYSTTATISCSDGISSLGSAGCSISSYGFAVGTASNPTIGNTLTTGGATYEVGTSYTTTDVEFSKDLTGLSPNTTYYVRPYATNGNGTAYGTQTSFTTLQRYAITYYKNDGGATSDVEYKDHGVDYTISSNKYSRSGHTLVKWHTLAAGTGGTDYALGATYSTNATLNLYAVWGGTISFNNNGGTGSMSSEVAVNGSSYSLPSCTFTPPAGKAFKCWAQGAADGTERAVGYSHTVSGNITFYAVWRDVVYTDQKFSCADWSITGPSGDIVFITSAASKTVRSQEAFHVSGSGLPQNTELTFAIFPSSNKFVIKKADGTIPQTNTYGVVDADVYVFYTPSGEDTGDGLDEFTSLTVSVTGEPRTATIDTKRVIGRHLPADFVIAAKKDGKWWALPATMTSATNPPAVEIAVDDINNPSIAYTASSNIYNLYGQKSENDATGSGQLYTENGATVKLGMKNNDNRALFGSTTGNYTISGNPVTITNNIGIANWWTLRQTATSITNPKDAKYTVICSNNTVSLKLQNSGTKWGFYNQGTDVEELRLIPASSVVFTEAYFVEWGQNGGVIEVDAGNAGGTGVAAAKVKAKLNGAESSLIALTETGTSKGSSSKYNYTVNFGGVINFAASTSAGQMLTLEWHDGSDVMIAVSNVMVPRIIASSATMSSIASSDAAWSSAEVHVLPGVTLTANAGDFSSNDVVINQLEIYPGATVEVTKGEAASGTLKVKTLVLRNGWTRAGEKAYDVARLYITPSTASLVKNAVSDVWYSDWYIDYDQYYPVAVPWKVTLATGLQYRYTKVSPTYGYDKNIRLLYYDGEGRAKGTNGSAGDGANWRFYGAPGGKAMPATLDPSKAYAMTAKRPTGKAFSIIRMTMEVPSADWTTSGEQGHVTVYAVTTHKDTVNVVAYNNDQGNAAEYAKGWNFIANPYMSLYQGQIGYTEGEETVRFVNIPDEKFKEYDQQLTLTAKLKPASGVLIQAPETGRLIFGTANRKLSMPSFYSETQKEKIPEQQVVVVLSDETNEDMMGLLVSDKYTAEYEINADLEKLLSDGNTLRTYMRYGDMNMAYVAINETLAKEWIPVSVRIPADGEYTFSLHEASIAGELEGVYLIDYQNGDKVTNLIEQSYTFSSTAGTINGRFSINAKVGERQTPTGIDAINAGGDINSDKPFKFIYHDKVYIWLNGVIYDTTGKRVK